MSQCPPPPTPPPTPLQPLWRTCRGSDWLRPAPALLRCTGALRYPFAQAEKHNTISNTAVPSTNRLHRSCFNRLSNEYERELQNEFRISDQSAAVGPEAERDRECSAKLSGTPTTAHDEAMGGHAYGPDWEYSIIKRWQRYRTSSSAGGSTGGHHPDQNSYQCEGASLLPIWGMPQSSFAMTRG